MLFQLFILFTVLPALELYILFKASNYMGGWNTIMVIVLTGIWGAYFAKSQGRIVILKIQTRLQSGELPTDDLFHGLLIFAGGLLLITPGFLTDVIGFSLIFPASRWLWFHYVKSYFIRKVKSGDVVFYSNVHIYRSGKKRKPQETMRDVTPENLKDINSPSSKEEE